MPHDKNGQLLKVGDTVLIEAVVENVQAGEEYCNCNVRTVAPMPPYDQGTVITLNTRQVMQIVTTIPDDSTETF